MNTKTLATLKKGDKIKHSQYGEAAVDQVFFDPGRPSVTMTLLTKEGKKKFAKHRNGNLPRCNEENLNKLIKI